MAFLYRTWGQSWGDSWGDSWGVEQAEAATGITSFARPIDFIVSPPYYMHEIQLYRNALGLAAKQHTDVSDAAEKRELVEMMKIYVTFYQDNHAR